MRVFAPSKVDSSLKIKLRHSKEELSRLGEEIRRKVKERNEITDALNRLKDTKKMQLERAIAPLARKKETLEAEVSHLEARKAVALEPTYKLKKRLANWQKELLDREDGVEYQLLDIEEYKKELARKEKRIDAVDKDVRNKRTWVKREIRDLEAVREETEELHEKAREAHKEAAYREKIAKEYEQKTYAYRQQVEEDQRAYRTMLDQQKAQLDREYAKIASDRAKLKNALDLEKKYASTRCKQCEASVRSKSSNRRSKASKD